MGKGRAEKAFANKTGLGLRPTAGCGWGRLVAGCVTKKRSIFETPPTLLRVQQSTTSTQVPGTYSRTKFQ